MTFLATGANFFDWLNMFWKKPLVERNVYTCIVVVFIIALFITLLKKFGLLPHALDGIIPCNIFFPIHLAFALVLGLEVISLIFSVADSTSRAVGKQLEIMALLLLRNIFKDISELDYVSALFYDYSLLWEILSLACAALFIFVCLGLYIRQQTFHIYEQKAYGVSVHVQQKKCVSLLLFIILLILSIYDIHIMIGEHQPSEFFVNFYNALIFTDILLVLMAHSLTPSFHATFRNSGFAVGTLLMRISIGAPSLWNVGLSIFAATYIVALTWATSKFDASALEIPPYSFDLSQRVKRD